MAVELSELVQFTNEYLGIAKIKDYCPNGLQVEGKAHVSTIIGGVTASQDLIDAAIEKNADAILVHHGYFWKGEGECVTGIKRKRLKALLENDISLLAYHLPLDVHTEVGNNVQLAAKLGFNITGALDPQARPSIGLAGELSESQTGSHLNKHISSVLGRECMHINASNRPIKTIAWCTGAAQGMIEQAVTLGVDAYVSGEISEPTVHIARENNIHYFSAGHHATERYGVMALGQYLREQFDLTFEFLDLDNPV